MHRFIAILACVLAVAGAGMGASHASNPDASIEEFAAAEMSASGIPGMAYGAADGGEISSGHRGVLSTQSGAPVEAGSTFFIGSVSKSFTALGVMQLVETGAVELDAPIARYLDVFDGKPHGAVTVRQLLSHTSGYSMLQGNLSQTDLTMDADALKRRVEKVAAMTPASPAGAKWEYSNANYQVLGRLIEAVSGQDFASYIQTNILSPIGMADSFVHGPGAGSPAATGHRPWFGSTTPSQTRLTGTGSGPQGGIVTSGRDMARYLSMMMNGQDDVLSAAGKAAMMQPASEASPFYGFGWFVNTDDGTVYHSGSNPGYEALATMIPAQRKGAAVIVNSGSGIGFGGTMQLRNGITARALGTQYGGEADPWMQKATFVMVALLPVMFVIAMVWAWVKRAAIRAKSGAFGLFSLWFPLVITAGLAIGVFALVPAAFGAPLGTIRLFAPDMGLSLIAAAITGVAWAMFRLAIAYTGARTQAH